MLSLLFEEELSVRYISNRTTFMLGRQQISNADSSYTDIGLASTRCVHGERSA